MGDSNFGMEQSFINIGGDSIKAMKLTAMSKKKGYNITVADLYREQTPARLAAYIDSMDGVKTQGIKEITPDSEHRYDKFPLIMFKWLIFLVEVMTLFLVVMERYSSLILKEIITDKNLKMC